NLLLFLVCSHLLTHELYTYPHQPTMRSTLFPYTTLFRSRILSMASMIVLSAVSNPIVKSVPAISLSIVAGTQMHGNPLLDKGFRDRKSTRLNSSHVSISYAVFCLKKTITQAYIKTDVGSI